MPQVTPCTTAPSSTTPADLWFRQAVGRAFLGTPQLTADDLNEVPCFSGGDTRTPIYIYIYIFHVAHLFKSGLNEKPSQKHACVYPNDTCETNFRALMIVVRELMLLCMVCHAKKYFAAIELEELRAM
jgi:hypothetical protein